MFVRFYGACALTITLLTSCGGEKAENKTDKKEEPKTESTEKKPEAEQKQKAEAPAKKDLASQLIGEWEIVKSFDPGGAEDGIKGTLTFTKTGFTRIDKSPLQPEANTAKGTWTLDPKLKNEDSAIDCVVFNNADQGDLWNLMSVTDKELVLVFRTMPQKYIYKKK